MARRESYWIVHRVQLVPQWIKLYSGQHRVCRLAYLLSVQLASDFKLSSDRIDGEGASLVPVHDGVSHVIERRPVQVLGHHLWINGNQKSD